MAARSKKKSSLSQSVQDAENALTENLAVAVAINSSDFADNAIESPNPTQALGVTPSEEIMNTETDLLKSQPSGERLADDPVGPVINLDSTLSIQNVVTLYEQLKKVYAAYDAIEIDASHVASVDTASLQLFAALKKDAAKQNKEVVFFQPSPRFIESARLLDLVGILEIIDV